MLTKEHIVNTIQEHMKEIKSYGVKKIGIFGSVATASNSEESDIDILIEFQKDKKAFDNYMELKFFLEELFHRKVDLVIEDALKSRIRDSVLREVSYA